MTYAEEYKDIVKAGRKESKDLGQKAQNAVIDTFALMDKADAEIARLNAKVAELENVTPSQDAKDCAALAMREAVKTLKKAGLVDELGNPAERPWPHEREIARLNALLAEAQKTLGELARLGMGRSTEQMRTMAARALAHSLAKLGA